MPQSVHQQQQQQQQQVPNMQNQQMPMAGFDQNDTQAWAQQMNMMAQNQQGAATDDAWSNSSNGRQNPIVPTTLNVEDWYVFLQSNSHGVPEDLLNMYNNQSAAFPA